MPRHAGVIVSMQPWEPVEVHEWVEDYVEAHWMHPVPQSLHIWHIEVRRLAHPDDAPRQAKCVLYPSSYPSRSGDDWLCQQTRARWFTQPWQTPHGGADAA